MGARLWPPLLPLVAAAAVGGSVAENNGLAITPPMGWNPYNCLSSKTAQKEGCWPASETVLMNVATALNRSGLHALGYNRINLDAGWALKERDNKTGRVIPDPSLYPSGFSKISDDLEAMGFHFGLYSDSGTLHCGGAAPGGLGHEEIDAHAYAEWGVTYLKYDNCFADTCAEYGCGNAPNDTIYRYTAMSNALNKTNGRHGPILFSMCEWGVANPAEWGPAVANTWRTTADISDVWAYMCELADLTAEWFDHAGPGGWNDPDLLEVGNNGMTTAEYRSHFAIWSLLKAPLLISTNVMNMSSDTLDILSKSEIIAINQDSLGVQGRLVEERPPDASLLQVWAGPLSGGRVAVVFWNRGNDTQEILGRFVDMQLYGKASVRDAWNETDLGVATGQITATVASHDVAVRVLTPVPSSEGIHELSDEQWRDKWRGHGIKYPASRKRREAARALARRKGS